MEPVSEVSQSIDERRRKVLTKAVVRAAGMLGLTQADLAVVLGTSDASVSRMKAGTYLVAGKEFELAAFLVRIFRSLDALMGGHRDNVKAWFNAENHHLSGTPASLVREIEGITRVARYLDFVRGAQ